jgi:hypothetical protein
MPTVTINRLPGTTASEATPPLILNGKRFPYSFGKPVDLPDDAIEVARTAGWSLSIEAAADKAFADDHSPASDDAGHGDAAASAQPGGQPGGGDTDDFDPEEIIKGKVADVAARLGDLTRDQLLAVQSAEEDREAPRAGVAEALTKALATFGD